MGDESLTQAHKRGEGVNLGVNTVYWEMIYPLVLAVMLGALLGWVSQARGRKSRTFAIICLGSCLVTLVSTYFFAELGELWTADPGRLAAQLIPALTFLGTGMIWLVETQKQRKLAPVANMWVTCVVGMMLGASLVREAVFVSIILVVLYVVLEKYEIKVAEWKARSMGTVEMEDKEEAGEDY